MSAVRLDISEREYHADPCDAPSLSASIAKTLLLQSPYHAMLKHPKLPGRLIEHSKAMDEGSLIHSLVLDGGTNLCVIYADDYRTNAAKQARDEARVNGLRPVLASKYSPALAVAKAITEQLAAKGITLNGESGVVLVWNEESSRGPVRCRAMLDHVWPGGFLELKTISSADLRTCERQTYALGYDIQLAAYTSALEHLSPANTGRIESIIAFAETDEPHCVSAFRQWESLAELGRKRWRRAVELWARCLAENDWPAYQPAKAIGYLSAPAWALTQEIEHGE